MHMLNSADKDLMSCHVTLLIVILLGMYHSAKGRPP